MELIETGLKGLYVVHPKPKLDSRGWFARIYDQDQFGKVEFPHVWVQINHSFSEKKGTIRGLHFQLPPYGETKMVKCIRGRIWDVVVDLRLESETYLQHFGIELSEENNLMLLIPPGFAHGFQTLEDHCGLIYFHSEYYQPGSEAGLRYNDPALNIHWPCTVSVISDRDQLHPLLNKEK
jgi:dTDP-4-dehydrorhamnose 3,5-epimerase